MADDTTRGVREAGPGSGREIGGGRYRLERRIASGGMGTVWEGYDNRLLRKVALKEVSLDRLPPLYRDEFLERAEREARNAAALADHPNIVTVHDVVLEDGIPWTVMQLVRGRSLADELQSGAMPVDAVAALAEQMLSALSFAHDGGIVHRDVKPLNIMLNDSDGNALLTDFGIAKGSFDVSLTQTGVVLGSAQYMAPERHEGEPGGPASDLFSLGVTLFEAVEGRSPFSRDSRTGTVTAILVQPLPAMTRAGRLGPLISALCEKNPGLRPSTETAQDLLHDRQKVTIPVSGGISGTRTRGRAQAALALPAFRQPSILTGHRRSLKALVFDHSGRTLASAGRDRTVRLWDVATGTETAVWTTPEVVHSPVFRADDGMLFGAAGQSLYEWDIASGQHTTWKLTPNHAGVFSPDGRTLAILDESIRLWDMHTGTQTASLPDAYFSLNRPAFSPDGSMLAVPSSNPGLQENAVHVWDVSSGELLDTKGGERIDSTAVAFSPDGRSLACFTETVIIWDFDSGRIRSVGSWDRGYDQGDVLFTADGTSLLVTGGRSGVRRFDLTTGQEPTLDMKMGRLRGVDRLALGPTGQVLAAAGSDRRIRLWHDPAGQDGSGEPL